MCCRYHAFLGINYIHERHQVVLDQTQTVRTLDRIAGAPKSTLARMRTRVRPMRDRRESEHEMRTRWGERVRAIENASEQRQQRPLSLPALGNESSSQQRGRRTKSAQVPAKGVRVAIVHRPRPTNIKNTTTSSQVKSSPVRAETAERRARVLQMCKEYDSRYDSFSVSFLFLGEEEGKRGLIPEENL